MSALKLFMVMLGGKPKGRHTEQHDIFFGIAEDLVALIPHFHTFWPEMKIKMHIDCWREITQVDGFDIEIVEKPSTKTNAQLFFLNLGGYKPGDFEEYHYKIVVAASEKSTAIQVAKRTAFYKHYTFSGATSHIDDKYGIDVDDIYAIEDILPKEMKSKYSIVLRPNSERKEDELHIGYLKMDKLKAEAAEREK